MSQDRKAKGKYRSVMRLPYFLVVFKPLVPRVSSPGLCWVGFGMLVSLEE